MKVFAIINEKGGVGKSSLALNLAYGLAELKGHRVLVVDADPQHNVSSVLLRNEDALSEASLNGFKSELEASKRDLDNDVKLLSNFVSYVGESSKTLGLNDVLLNPSDMESAILTTRFENIDILPASHDLSVSDYELKNMRNRDGRLRKALENVSNLYDYAIIDNSPFESALTYNAITACANDGDRVIIPTKIDFESLAGLSHTMTTLIDWLKETTLQYDVGVIGMMIGRTKLSKVGVETLKLCFGDRMLDNTVRYQNGPVQLASFNNEILLESKSNVIKKMGAYQDYLALIDELYERWG